MENGIKHIEYRSKQCMINMCTYNPNINIKQKKERKNETKKNETKGSVA